MLNTGEIVTLLNVRGYTFQRALGQHFLINDDVLDRIVQASGVTPADDVLEIGPGPGFLTIPLLQAARRVLAVEVDRAAIAVLETAAQGAKNLTIVRADAAKADLAALAKEAFDGPFDVVSNLPYAITTPLLQALLAPGLPVRRLTLMMQKEAAARLLAQPGGKEYGPLSLLREYRTEAEAVLDVPPECFLPPPHVDSTVVRLEVRPRSLSQEEEAAVWRLVQAAFAMRRKTLLNNLTAAFSGDRAAFASLLGKCGIDPKARAETISLNAFIDLSKNMQDLLR